MKRTRVTIGKRPLLRAGLIAALPLCLLVLASCSKTDEASTTPPAPPGEARGGPGGPPPGGPGMRGGPGGPGGGMRGGAPLAESASGAEIYQASCRCHGPEGQGGRAPVLTALAGQPDDNLFKVIHDGKGKMPSFGTQLSEAQIKKVVAYIKQLKPKS